ncbi:MAG: class A beta-lactamase-related serine hydrolase [Clostridiales bacterium]|nr:class A beta-lactamase-related serine hydrolase [Clostridiales bacterium]
MKKSDSGGNRNTVLYIIILILCLALFFLGTLTFFSMAKLGSIQNKITELEDMVDDIATASAELVAQSERLNSADTAAETSASEEQAETATEDREEGTLSPSTETSAFSDVSDGELDSLMNQINALLPTDNGSWSVYVCNLASDSSASINNASMQAASLIKLYIMGAVYENYDSLSLTYDTTSLDSYLYSMITVSDNDAANTLVSCLGGGDSSAGMAVVNQFCQNHGYTGTSMGRLLLESTENGDNYTTVEDCGSFLREVYQINAGTAQNASLSHADAMYTLLKQQTRTNKIPANMPEGVGVANKTGELSDVENDAGIVYNTARGIDLVIVFMSENLTSAGDAQTEIAEDSRMIYGYYNE